MLGAPLRRSGSAPRARGTRDRGIAPRSTGRFSPACAGNTHLPLFARHDISVQPRVRGEHDRRKRHRPHRLRFSPACAGNTSGGACGQPSKSVQPRVRGEHSGNSGTSRGTVGSAPRARGTPVLPPQGSRRRRFSPACAGNTPPRPPVDRIAAVQPRVRGEHKIGPLPWLNRDGSAPRARGTLGHWFVPVGRHRFSPACAGNTLSSRCSRRRRAVQPRVRGEHPSATVGAAATYGSAPRARGTLWQAWGVPERLRFSPACAGNTRCRNRGGQEYTVQPRVRGEHATMRRVSVDARGSAPRARGTRVRRAYARACRRFSPACAGNTSPNCNRPEAPAVQPRVRGEHLRDHFFAGHLDGSAPRARGTHGRPAIG